MTLSLPKPRGAEDLELHFGLDYGVAMLPRETTETATVQFGRCQDAGSQRAARRFVRRYNSQPELYSAGLEALDQMIAVQASLGGDGDAGLARAIKVLKSALRKARS